MILRFINGGDDGIFNFLMEGVHGTMAGEGSSRKNWLSREAFVLIEVIASVLYLLECDDMYFEIEGFYVRRQDACRIG